MIIHLLTVNFVDTPARRTRVSYEFSNVFFSVKTSLHSKFGVLVHSTLLFWFVTVQLNIVLDSSDLNV